jgi:hypothetical protein
LGDLPNGSLGRVAQEDRRVACSTPSTLCFHPRQQFASCKKKATRKAWLDHVSEKKESGFQFGHPVAQPDIFLDFPPFVTVFLGFMRPIIGLPK